MTRAAHLRFNATLNYFVLRILTVQDLHRSLLLFLPLFEAPASLPRNTPKSQNATPELQ